MASLQPQWSDGPWSSTWLEDKTSQPRRRRLRGKQPGDQAKRVRLRTPSPHIRRLTPSPTRHERGRMPFERVAGFASPTTSDLMRDVSPTHHCRYKRNMPLPPGHPDPCFCGSMTPNRWPDQTRDVIQIEHWAMTPNRWPDPLTELPDKVCLGSRFDVMDQVLNRVRTDRPWNTMPSAASLTCPECGEGFNIWRTHCREWISWRWTGDFHVIELANGSHDQFGLTIPPDHVVWGTPPASKCGGTPGPNNGDMSQSSSSATSTTTRSESD